MAAPGALLAAIWPSMRGSDWSGSSALFHTNGSLTAPAGFTRPCEALRASGGVATLGTAWQQETTQPGRMNWIHSAGLSLCLDGYSFTSELRPLV